MNEKISIISAIFCIASVQAHLSDIKSTKKEKDDDNKERKNDYDEIKAYDKNDHKGKKEEETICLCDDDRNDRRVENKNIVKGKHEERKENEKDKECKVDKHDDSNHKDNKGPKAKHTHSDCEEDQKDKKDDKNERIWWDRRKDCDDKKSCGEISDSSCKPVCSPAPDDCGVIDCPQENSAICGLPINGICGEPKTFYNECYLKVYNCFNPNQRQYFKFS